MTTPGERMQAIGVPTAPVAESPASAGRLFGYLSPWALFVVVVTWGALVQYAAGNVDVQLGSVLCLAGILVLAAAMLVGRVVLELQRPGGRQALRRVALPLVLLAFGPGLAMAALLRFNLLKGWMPS